MTMHRCTPKVNQPAMNLSRLGSMKHPKLTNLETSPESKNSSSTPTAASALAAPFARPQPLPTGYRWEQRPLPSAAAGRAWAKPRLRPRGLQRTRRPRRPGRVASRFGPGCCAPAWEDACCPPHHRRSACWHDLAGDCLGCLIGPIRVVSVPCHPYPSINSVKLLLSGMTVSIF